MSKGEKELIDEYFKMGWSVTEIVEGIDAWHYGRKNGYKALIQALEAKVKNSLNYINSNLSNRDKIDCVRNELKQDK